MRGASGAVLGATMGFVLGASRALSSLSRLTVACVRLTQPFHDIARWLTAGAAPPRLASNSVSLVGEVGLSEDGGIEEEAAADAAAAAAAVAEAASMTAVVVASSSSL